MISDISFNESTGTIIFTRKNGATITLDTKLEKLAVNFGYDAENERLVITLDDGTEQYVDISALITVYEFFDSDTIAFSVDDTGKVSAIVKEGSIEEKHLQPNYLADIKIETASAETSAQAAASSAIMAESFASGGTGARENEDVDNAKYYFEQAKDISKGMNGLIPMGTITFAELSNEDNQVDKFMFNISENFTTDDTFREGAGHEYPAGVNVYRTSDGYWDCLAGNFVAGVKGAKESIYREGFVVLTPENIGALPEDGDSAENTVTYTSGDAVDSEDNSLAWTDVAVLESGEKHSSLWAKVSTMFKNVRYLFKALGSTDISGIGDGTCTGAISTLNTDLKNVKSGYAYAGTKFASGTVSRFPYIIKNGWCFVTLEATPSSDVANGDVVGTGLPTPAITTYLTLQATSGNYPAKLDKTTNELTIYFPNYVTASRIDTCFCYPLANS